MLNEIFLLQILTIIVLFYFLITINILILWYIAGIYLMSLGIFLICDDGDIFIGFLWVIDIGVGLIFFIFILHFSNFLFQKIPFNISLKILFLFFIFFIFILSFFFFISNPIDLNFNYELKKTWFFLLTWYDYYSFYYSKITTDLNMLREIYFYNNSFEFFLINFMIFYGIFAAINLTFLIKKVFNFMSFNQVNNYYLLKELNTVFFIRNQNFIKQQNTSAGTRVWNKNKNFKI